MVWPEERGMRVLVTGGAGYIGSHTCVELLQAGHEVTVLDNLCNSREESLRRVQEIAGKKLRFVREDLLDADAVRGTLREGRFDAVIHFAALKAVGESSEKPLAYYHNNVTGTIVLLESMREAGVRNMVFSSSATVYGEDNKPPMVEGMPISAINPYGRTKVMMEQIMRDLTRAEKEWNLVILRYFNPVGAHPSGRIGEDPRGVPANLVPFITQVAAGKRPELRVFGADYPTPDGTCVRDYIHIVDLARGHLAALSKLASKPGLLTYNLGTGRGHSVFEVIRAFQKATGVKIPYRVVERRPGDSPESWADPSLAEKDLGWKARYGIEEACADAWRWQSENPNGYA
jgi:UDP-glucose 4-epimerase